MTEVKQIYKCEVCGNIVEVLHNGGGTLTCCGQPMKLIEENAVDATVEKHVPVIEEIDGGVLIKVGSTEHPMLSDHYIEWIEVHTKDNIYRKYLKPGENPEATFKLNEKLVMVREYCNLHGLWKKQ